MQSFDKIILGHYLEEVYGQTFTPEALDYYEAVHTNNAARMMQILKQRMERKVGQKVYITRVPDVVREKGHKYYGLFIMFGDGKHAIRLKWKTNKVSEAIVGIDFWTHVSGDPQFSADTTGMNIVQIVNLIDDVIHGIKNSSLGDLNEDEYLEAAGKSFKDVKGYLDNKGYSIEKDPAFTVRRYLITNLKTKEVTPIGYTPTMAQMYDDLNQMGVDGFLNKFKAGQRGKNTSSILHKAVIQEPEEIRNTEFDALFEKRLSEDEIFSFLEKSLNDVKSGRSKTLIISGDAGLGKCGHYTLDLPVQFL